MQADVDVPELTAEDVAAPLRALLGAGAVLDSWTVTPLPTSVKATTQAFRVRGVAGGRRWSAVLKVVDEGEPGGARERAAYEADILLHQERLLGAPALLCAPARCGRATYLWLDDLGDDTYGRWPLWRYRTAAQHLGLWNGAHTGTRALERPFLSRGWLRAWIDACASAMAELPQRGEEPLVRLAYPARLAEGVLRVWERREALLDGLDRLPPCLAHLDVHRNNLIARDRSGAPSRTFLVDWQSVGVGAVGVDAAPLVGSALTEGLICGSDAERLESEVFRGYLDGLRQAGWEGSERDARAGHAATAALRYTVGTVRFLLPVLLDRALGGELARLLGRPLAAIAEGTARVLPLFLALADEAGALLAP